MHIIQTVIFVIEKSSENVRLDFVYDSSATLIGVNTVEGHYFYIRDITGNILGLIDNEGNYIIKYKYNAWGKVLEKKICESCIEVTALQTKKSKNDGDSSGEIFEDVVDAIWESEFI